MTDTVASPQPQRAELTREYVASVSDGWFSVVRNRVRSLPIYVDSLEAELGDDSYQRMLTDPQVASAVSLLKAAILEDSVTYTPAQVPQPEPPPDDADGEPPPPDPAAEQAAAIHAFVARVLDQLTTPLEDVLWDLLDCIAFGARIAEEVWAVAGEGEDAGRMVITAIKPKPRTTVAFVVDPYLNVVGLIATQPGQGMLLGGAAITDEQRGKVLPREKFAVLTWRPKDGDPRGSSQLRPAYNPWWIKQQEWPEFIKLLFQFATPSVYGTTGPDADGDPESGQSAEDLLLASLINVQNGSAGAFPAGTLIDTIEAGEGGAAAFDSITELLNQEITKAILGSTRATMESEYGSRADSQTSKGLFDSLVRAGRRTVARMLQRDVVNQLVILNFGRDALPLAPRVAVGGVEEEDRTPAWTAIAALERAGYLDPSQYAALDAAAGLPVRSPEDVAARRARRAAPPPATPVAAPGGAGQGDQGEGSDQGDDEEGDGNGSA